MTPGHGDRRPLFPAHATQRREQIPHPARIRSAGFGMVSRGVFEFSRYERLVGECKPAILIRMNVPL
jgi:hypothetical protein